MMQLSRIFSKQRIALLVALTPPLVTSQVLAGDGANASGGVPGIAEREIARRMARIEDARQAMEKGDELYAKGDHEAALAYYRTAKDIFDQLPNAPFIQDWRDLANLKFADCAGVVAREKAIAGDYVAARRLIDEAQAAVPGHKATKLFAKHLDDPDRWPPALTPQHVENVAKVQKQLLLANSAYEIGDYDKALNEFDEVLRIDPYNTSARRGMERVEQKRQQYFKSARDHQRARMLSMVDEAWEQKPAVRGLQIDTTMGGGREPSGYLTKKMQALVFPSVNFAGASVEEAIEFLRVKSRDIDISETDPAKKGVNIILKTGDVPSTAQISLDLKDVPMIEALRYVTELAGMKFKVEPYAVLVVPATDATSEQFTRIYKVPPDFLSLGGGGGAAPAGGGAAADPFASTAAPAGGNSTLAPRQSAQQILASQGVPFPEGASAFFNRASSQLIVKNTQPNLDLVETFVESIQNQVQKQIYITSKFVEVTQKNTDELGFDWLLGGFGTNADNVVVGGGTGGNSANVASYPAAISALGLAPVTSGIRSGTSAITGDSIDSLIRPTPQGSAPGVLSVAGIFTDPQFAVLIRALSQRKGVDLMSAPSVTTKGGQRASVEVVREFIYPTEFDPPQIPTNVGGGGGGGDGTTIAIIPVTPTTPTAFTTRQVGVRMEVDPTVSADGYTIDMTLSPEVTEFDGFINYGSPIYTINPETLRAIPNPLATDRIEMTPNVINQPVFSTRRVQTLVTVWDGQTVALGGLIREDVQDVEDKVPVLGDIPFLGRLFRTQAEDHFKRNLMIFVTARMIDPAGQPINANVGGNTAPTSTPGPSSPLLPAVGGE